MRMLIFHPNGVDEEHQMSQSTIDNAKAELEAAKSTLDAALNAWDASVSELWRTSLALTQAQKRLTPPMNSCGVP
jgi:hypothetical protein